MDTFNLIRDAGHVKRCHTVQMHGEQTVGHHTYGVICIILELWPECSKSLIKAALYHDVPEFLTGDTPATAKWAYKPLADGIKQAESAIMDQHCLNVELTEEEERRLHIADLLELAMTSFEQLSMGNRLFNPIFQRCVTVVRDRYGTTKDGMNALSFLLSWTEQKRVAVEAS